MQLEVCHTKYMQNMVILTKLGQTLGQPQICQAYLQHASAEYDFAALTTVHPLRAWAALGDFLSPGHLVLGHLHNAFLDERRTPPGIVAVKDGDCLRLCDARIADEQPMPTSLSPAGIFSCSWKSFNDHCSTREFLHIENDQMSCAKMHTLPDNAHR
jgi:hypothetical protein